MAHCVLGSLNFASAEVFVNKYRRGASAVSAISGVLSSVSNSALWLLSFFNRSMRVLELFNFNNFRFTPMR